MILHRTNTAVNRVRAGTVLLILIPILLILDVTVKNAKAACGDAPAPHVDWRNCDLTDMDLSGADLTGANLAGAIVNNANLNGAILSGAIMSGTVGLTDIHLQAAADVSKINLLGMDLQGFDLSDLDLSGANLTGSNLSGANLGNASMDKANLKATIMRNVANLAGWQLREAQSVQFIDLAGMDLSGFDLSHVNFGSAILTGVNFTGAIVDHMNINKADLSGAGFTGATGKPSGVRQAIYSETLCPDGERVVTSPDTCWTAPTAVTMTHFEAGSSNRQTWMIFALLATVGCTAIIISKRRQPVGKSNS